MSKLSDLKALSDVLDVEAFKQQLREQKSLQGACGCLLDRANATFEQSFVLTRMFMSLPYSGLPDFQRFFVDQLAADAGVADQVLPNTPVLTLLASRGVEKAWNEVEQSSGHVAIPLVSSAFVSGIPMVARLFNDLGLRLEILDQVAEGMDMHVLSEVSGIFFVPDAGTSMDGQGRHIIPAQDFVAKYGVRSVFGIGGQYMVGAQGSILVAVFFTTETLEKFEARKLAPLINHLKTVTSALVMDGKIFDA